MSSEWSIQINPSGCYNQMVKATHGHLANFRAILRAIDDGTFTERVQTSSPDSFMNFQLMESAVVPSDAAPRAAANCFKAIIAEFISFLDRLIATRRFVSRPTVVERGLSGYDEIKAYLRERMEREYLEVARDRALTNPRKLRELGVAPAFASVANSFFTLRRCIEHHGGIPDTEIRLDFRRIKLCIEGEELVGPRHFEAGKFSPPA